MPPYDSSQWVCAGSKRISIKGDSSLTDGIVSVFCRPQSNAAPDDAVGTDRRCLSGGSDGVDDCLHVFINNGSQSFYESIARANIKRMVSEDGQQLEKVTSILLRPDDETFKVSYKRVEGQLLGGSHDSKNTTSVKVSIRKTCANNIVRPVWEGQFNNVCHSCYDDLPLFARCALPDEIHQTESSSGLAFSLMLGDTINKLHKEIDALRTENKQLEANTLRWKSTSDKLSDQWEAEKSELTGRFLTLFNEHKARHVETQKELNHLKGKKQRTDETLTNRSSSRRKSRETFPDDEDGRDYACYDDDEINRLAAGERQTNNRKPRASQKQNCQNSQSQRNGFVNPHTGAMEFSNPKELFSSESEDDDLNI
mmetsp:Transcript_3490/g.8885  ORF Transcript_3490/g.8885 Transcript_3490/m.8885 type:complete len:368 (-) Transcript_3490:89-1192(-)